MPFFTRLFAVFALLGLCAPASYADAYDAKPRLVVILVFDQFRGDYLDRYRAEFKSRNGWNLFLKQGAHFTDCYYDYANLVTAAGHATIGTGAYTDGHGIPLNEWYEPGPDGQLHYAGKVGTGFDRSTLTSLHTTLAAEERPDPPFAPVRGLPHAGVHWVQPRLVAQVGFSEWTPDGELRHPRYQGLRRDKAPAEVVRELP